MICVVEAKSRSDDGNLNNFSPIKPYFRIIGVAGYLETWISCILFKIITKIVYI